MKKRFTKWYIEKGYTFDYKFVKTGEHELGMEPYFNCPWWVKPLCVFFSPSIYVREVTLKGFGETFSGLLKGKNSK